MVVLRPAMLGAWRQTRTPFDHHTGGNYPSVQLWAGHLRHLTPQRRDSALGAVYKLDTFWAFVRD